VLVLSDAPDETLEAWLRKVDVSSERIAGKVGVIRGYREFMQGEVTRAMTLLQHSLPRLPAEETLFRGVASWLLSLFHVVTGDFSTGSQALEEVVRTSLQKNHLIVAAGALCALAEVHLRLGQLHEAGADYERALSIARDGERRLPIAARALMGLGDLWREWNDLDQALRCCADGIELAKSLRESAAIAGYLTLARIRQATGDMELSREAMRKAWELAQGTEETGLDDLYVRLSRARLEIMRGDLEAAEHWMQERSLTGECDPAGLDRKEDYYQYHILKYEVLVAARWFIAANRPQEALNLLAHLLSRMEEQGRVHLVIESLLLSALAHRKLGDPARATACFERSLALAEPGGYVRVFLDEGPPVGPLLQAAARTERTSDYARRLLAALEAEASQGARDGLPPRTSPSQPPGIVEPLTERELELLGLIAKGLSNQEIAQRLFVALPTVKWHTGNIYGKLGVRRRTQAVARARSLGILPTA
jgi:LuxR family maltose regulon positive regulatory protein